MTRAKAKSVFFAVLVSALFACEALAQSASVPADFAVPDTSQYNLITDSTSAITVSGLDPLRVTVSASSGNIRVTTTSGLTAPTGYSSSDWAGASEIAFTGSLADVNAALATFGYQGTGTITVAPSPPDIIFGTATNHFYEFVSTNLLWANALSSALTRTLNGVNGYLAVVTSANENSDLIDKLGPYTDCTGTGANYCASGGSFVRAFLAGSDHANEGVHVWSAGPESGSQFWQGNGLTGNAVNNEFTAWSGGEPSDLVSHGQDQDYLWLNSTGEWENVQNVSSAFIVEYEAPYSSFTVSELTSHSISMLDVERELDAGSFTIADPSSSSSGAFSYSISNSGVATISGNTVTPVGIGSATITATQAADSTYASASTTFSLTVTENGTSVTSCADAAARASHYIATGNSGYCGGSLTKAAAYIYEIWLGDSSTGMTASCRIWTGTLPVMRHQYQAGEKAQGGPIDVKNCSDGTYDTIHLIKSRYLQFAGYASYPAPSGSASHGNTARSTTTFATSNADHAVLGDWLEDSTGFAASGRPYVRTTSSATSIYKKLAAQPSSSDLASSSDADMYFDEYKRLTASQNNTSSGWLCEGASSQTVCAQILSNDANRLEWRYTNAAPEVSGLPIILRNAKGCSLTIDLSYKSADTSNNQNTGINFLWRNNSGTVEMVGVKPDDGDINISLGKPKC